MKTYRIVWHSIRDVEFDVDAFSEDDAMHTPAAWQHGEDGLDDLVREIKSVQGR